VLQQWVSYDLSHLDLMLDMSPTQFTKSMFNFGLILACLHGVCYSEKLDAHAKLELEDMYDSDKSQNPLSLGKREEALHNFDVYHYERFADDIFKPFRTDPPPKVIPSIGPHERQPKSIQQNKSIPIHTNKFYSNFFLGDQQKMSWTQPYGIWWDKEMHALGISHAEPDDYEWGPPTEGLEAKYNYTKSFYAGPIRKMSMGFSAVEFDESTILELDGLDLFTVNVSLVHPKGYLTMPLTQGQGFNTAVYNKVKPQIVTHLNFTSMKTYHYTHRKLTKMEVKLGDGSTWLIFTCPNPGSEHFALIHKGPTIIAADAPFDGAIQIVKIPREDFPRADHIYVCLAGMYPIGASLSGLIDRGRGIYSIRYHFVGTSLTGMLMYAYHHHTTSWGDFDIKEDIQMLSTSKGMMQGYNHDHLTLIEEDMPPNVNWLPWLPAALENSTSSFNKTSIYTPAALRTFAKVAREEINADSRMLDSVEYYVPAKEVHRMSQICLVVNDILHNDGWLTRFCYHNLVMVLAYYKINMQLHPLMYDLTYKGIVSYKLYRLKNAPQEMSPDGYYYFNHFHEYGYLIGACAVMAHMDPTWLVGHQDWVDMLVRDIANPSAADPYFPKMRSFDFFQGHSTVDGLHESVHGRAWTSVSEDLNTAHAIKLWGLVTNNTNLEGLGKTMSAVILRTAKRYIFMGQRTGIVPNDFKMNVVPGVVYENKADHRPIVEYDSLRRSVKRLKASTGDLGPFLPVLSNAQAAVAHIRPISQLTPYLRHPNFVEEEYNVLFQRHPDVFDCDECRGLYYANLALINPKESYKFFLDGDNKRFLDQTQSRVWSLAFAAALGGAD